MPALLFFAMMAVLGYSSSIVLGQQAAVSVGEVDATWLSRRVARSCSCPSLFEASRVLSRNQWIAIFVMGGLDVLGVIAVNASGHFPGKEFADRHLRLWRTLGHHGDDLPQGKGVARTMGGPRIIIVAVASMAVSQARDDLA